jgi:hypothetical protein
MPYAKESDNGLNGHLFLQTAGFENGNTVKSRYITFMQSKKAIFAVDLQKRRAGPHKTGVTNKRYE